MTKRAGWITLESGAVESHPQIINHVYEAGHGFVSGRSGHHDPDAARLAMGRTLALFEACH